MSMQAVRFQVEDVECFAISDGTLAVDAEYLVQFFSGAAPNELDAALRKHGLNPEGIQLDCTCLLINTGAHKVLVDTGAGPSLDSSLGRCVTNLKAAGIAPEAIDHIILSHGHWDHVCGCVDDAGRPIFPNAQYTMARGEWTCWARDYEIPEGEEYAKLRAVRRNLLAIQDHLALVEPPAEVVPGVSIIPTPGHTANHVSVVVDSGGAHLIAVVDTMDLPVHVEHIDWYPEWDENPEQMVQTRRELLQRAVDQGALVHGFHFPFPGVGTVRREGSGFRFVPLNG